MRSQICAHMYAVHICTCNSIAGVMDISGTAQWLLVMAACVKGRHEAMLYRAQYITSRDNME